MTTHEHHREWLYILEERRGVLSGRPGSGPLPDPALEARAQAEARQHMDALEKLEHTS